MKRKILVFSLLCCLLFSINRVSEASDKEVIKIEDFTDFPDKDRYETIMINEKGEIVAVPLEDINFDPMLFSYSETYPALLNRSLSSLSEAPLYTSSLGPYNNRTGVMASSQSSKNIDYMYITVSAYYPAGSFIGSDTVVSPEGWIILRMSASVDVPANPFAYVVGSAYSYHNYQNAGYLPVSHSLSWPD